ncbi:hypothetical protein [Dehalobacter sp. TeCB1]|uniref:hypothetical protein n=1 Tax=Dehalobacter sp. TeCB1 TaxID=1843715 RepID=UPI00083A5568|nr:hypothetical protein [Dehalobacter sp. TeCB1]OCZ50844.1 hypothetical protein A7D23_14190 [Dehalobacter sp. TeCB1]
MIYRHSGINIFVLKSAYPAQGDLLGYVIDHKDFQNRHYNLVQDAINDIDKLSQRLEKKKKYKEVVIKQCIELLYILKRIPNQVEFSKYTNKQPLGVREITDIFGSWEDFLQACITSGRDGKNRSYKEFLKPHEGNMRFITTLREFSDDECFEALKDAGRALGSSFTMAQYDQWQKENRKYPTGSVIQQRVGWNKAKIQLNLNPLKMMK